MPRARAGASRCGHLGGENALYGDTGRHHAQHRTLRAAPLQHPPRKERAPSGRGVEPGGRQRAGIARPRRGRGLRAQLLRACSTYAPAEPLLVPCAVGAVARTPSGLTASPQHARRQFCAQISMRQLPQRPDQPGGASCHAARELRPGTLRLDAHLTSGSPHGQAQVRGQQRTNRLCKVAAARWRLGLLWT